MNKSRQASFHGVTLGVLSFTLLNVHAAGADEKPGRTKTSVEQEILALPDEWNAETGKNIKWRVRLGHVPWKTPPPHAARAANSSPCISGGKVFIGSANAGWIPRYPQSEIYMGTLLCFDEKTGAFLWQHSNKQLAAGGIHDQYLGVASTPHVEGDRLWYVNTRCEVVCLDTEGFRDGENDGPFQAEKFTGPKEADVVWKFSMIDRLGVFPLRLTASTPAVSGNLLFINTCNGINEKYYSEAEAKQKFPAPNAPNFIAVDKRNGKIVWTDNSVGTNILRCGWASPTFAVLDGVPQVLFPGGDGWLYSFDPKGDGNGKGKLLWKFDCNPKTSKWGVRGTRKHFIAPAVAADGLVYVATGRELTFGEGEGHLWCIDPTKRGDVSPELVFNRKSQQPDKPIPHKRIQACVPADGDFTRPNPNSALVWHLASGDVDGNGEIDLEERIRHIHSRFSVKNGLLLVMDAGMAVHCVDAETGKRCWTHLTNANNGIEPPIILGDFIYLSNGDEIIVLRLHADPQVAKPNGAPVRKFPKEGSVFGMPVVSNNVLYVHSMFPAELIAVEQAANNKSPTREPPANR